MKTRDFRWGWRFQYSGADPEYGRQSAYKLMGAHTNLIPMTPQWVFPDMRLASGAALLILFFASCWIRAELRTRR